MKYLIDTQAFRLLIVTVLSENIPIISADEKFKNDASIITLIEA